MTPSLAAQGDRQRQFAWAAAALVGCVGGTLLLTNSSSPQAAQQGQPVGSQVDSSLLSRSQLPAVPQEVLYPQQMSSPNVSSPIPSEQLLDLLESQDAVTFCELAEFLAAMGQFSTMSDAEKSLVYRAALRKDPFQEYCRSRIVATSSEDVAALILGNGKLIFEGELDGIATKIELLYGTTAQVKLAFGDKALNLTFSGYSEAGGHIFKSTSASGEAISQLVLSRGQENSIVCVLEIPGRDVVRFSVSEGREILDVPPASILPMIQELLWPTTEVSPAFGDSY